MDYEFGFSLLCVCKFPQNSYVLLAQWLILIYVRCITRKNEHFTFSFSINSYYIGKMGGIKLGVYLSSRRKLQLAVN